VESLERLAVALAIGLLIGTERGWRERESAEGVRVAGVRTFGLVALLGAVWGLVSARFGEVLLGFAFLAFAALVAAAFLLSAREDRDYGITTAVAALLTFALGALAAAGEMLVAAATAVVVSTLLGLKPVLHSWLRRLQQRELYAVFKLLLISIVLLPVLPNRGYGPWQAINPFEIWLLVVLIAGISFVGYFAVKIVGTRRGLPLTGLFGGLASSTAVTLSFSRLGRQHPAAQNLLAAGVILAAGTMFPRMLLEVWVVNAALLPVVAAPLAAMTVVSYTAVPWLLYAGRGADTQAQPLQVDNPFELLPALKFGLLLVVILLLAEAARAMAGDAGLYVVAAISGITDVDAITLSIARMARGDVPAGVAGLAIVIAAVVNTAVKAVLVTVICRGAMARRVVLSLGLAIVAAVLVSLYTLVREPSTGLF